MMGSVSLLARKKSIKGHIHASSRIDDEVLLIYLENKDG